VKYRESAGVIVLIAAALSIPVGRTLGHDLRILAGILMVASLLLFYFEREHRRRAPIDISSGRTSSHFDLGGNFPDSHGHGSGDFGPGSDGDGGH